MLSALLIRGGLERLPVQSYLHVWILFIEYHGEIAEVPGFKNHDDQGSELLGHCRIVGELRWGRKWEADEWTSR